MLLEISNRSGLKFGLSCRLLWYCFYTTAWNTPNHVLQLWSREMVIYGLGWCQMQSCPADCTKRGPFCTNQMQILLFRFVLKWGEREPFHAELRYGLVGAPAKPVAALLLIYGEQHRNPSEPRAEASFSLKKGCKQTVPISADVALPVNTRPVTVPNERTT